MGSRECRREAKPPKDMAHALLPRLPRLDDCEEEGVGFTAPLASFARRQREEQ